MSVIHSVYSEGYYTYEQAELRVFGNVKNEFGFVSPPSESDRRFPVIPGHVHCPLHGELSVALRPALLSDPEDLQFIAALLKSRGEDESCLLTQVVRILRQERQVAQ